MADYYPLIARAVEGLSDKSPPVRRAVYERARNALLAQLQSLQPPVAAADIERERASLDLAIGSVEALYVLPSQQIPTEIHLPQEPSQRLLEPLDPERNGYQQPDQIPADALAERIEPEDATEVETPVIVDRPRIGSKHHSSGQANRVRAIILVASVLAVVIGIASYKLYDREQQAKVQALVEQQQNSEQPEAAQSETGKFNDRLGGTVVPEQTTQNPGDQQPATVAVQQAILFETDPATAQLPPGAQKLIASAGLTKWNLEQLDVGQGAPLETVVHGIVDFPQVGFKLDLQIRKNNDGSSIAQLIVLQFSHAATDTDHEVINVNNFVAKDTPTDDRGLSLSVRPVPIAKDVFMLALSDTASEIERNMQLLESKNWLWIEVIFPDGRRGSIAIEKGPTGFQVISDAIRRWR